MRRLIGGIAGWLCGVVPLVAVNAADYLGLLTYQDAFVAGALGMLGGVLLGGIVAGVIGGRGGVGHSAGAGGIAAALYATTVVGLLLGASAIEPGSPLTTVDPLRVGALVAFVATLLLALALATGALTGRSARHADVRMPVPSSANHRAGVPYGAGAPQYGPPRQPSPSRQRPPAPVAANSMPQWPAMADRRDSASRPRGPGAAPYTPQAAPTPSRSASRPAPRDDGWR